METKRAIRGDDNVNPWKLYCPQCGAEVARAPVQGIYEKVVPKGSIEVYNTETRKWVEATGVRWAKCLRQDAYCEPCGCVVNESTLIARREPNEPEDYPISLELRQQFWGNSSGDAGKVADISVEDLPYRGRFGVEPLRDVEVLLRGRWVRIPKDKCHAYYDGNLSYNYGPHTGFAAPSQWKLVGE